MNSQQNHEMQLEVEHASGAELWHVEACGRQFLLSYPPEYKKIILDAGDESAIHSGGKGGLSMGQLQTGDVEELELPENIRASVEKILSDFD